MERGNWKTKTKEKKKRTLLSNKLDVALAESTWFPNSVLYTKLFQKEKLSKARY